MQMGISFRKRMIHSEKTRKSNRCLYQSVFLMIVMIMVCVLFASCTSNPSPPEQPSSGNDKPIVNNGEEEEKETLKVALTVDTVSERVVKASVEGDTQYVVTSLTATSYEPILVQKGIPVKWILTVPGDSLNDCNNAIIIPQYSIEMDLKAGDNVIEFIPNEAGSFYYYCWMEMIFAMIYVADADGTIPPMKDEVEHVTRKNPCCPEGLF